MFEQEVKMFSKKRISERKKVRMSLLCFIKSTPKMFDSLMSTRVLEANTVFITTVFIS